MYNMRVHVLGGELCERPIKTDYNQYTVELKGYIGVGPTLKSAS